MSHFLFVPRYYRMMSAAYSEQNHNSKHEKTYPQIRVPSAAKEEEALQHCKEINYYVDIVLMWTLTNLKVTKMVDVFFNKRAKINAKGR